MCDYSLEMYRSRPAQVGEKYVTFRFPSGTVGLIAPGDPATAVCMACDAGLRLEGIPDTVQSAYGVPREVEAGFTRLEAGPHHDGVRFADGRQVSLQVLGAGVEVSLVEALWRPVRSAQTVSAS